MGKKNITGVEKYRGCFKPCNTSQFWVGYVNLQFGPEVNQPHLNQITFFSGNSAIVCRSTKVQNNHIFVS